MLREREIEQIRTAWHADGTQTGTQSAHTAPCPARGLSPSTHCKKKKRTFKSVTSCRRCASVEVVRECMCKPLAALVLRLACLAASPRGAHARLLATCRVTHTLRSNAKNSIVGDVMVEARCAAARVLPARRAHCVGKRRRAAPHASQPYADTICHLQMVGGRTRDRFQGPDNQCRQTQQGFTIRCICPSARRTTRADAQLSFRELSGAERGTPDCYGASAWAARKTVGRGLMQACCEQRETASALPPINVQAPPSLCTIL